MRKCKDTKRALLISVLSVALCLAMLVGTTFAWFTDVARTGYSTITSGRLDIVLQYKDGETWKSAEGKTLNFVKAAGHEAEEILWEPGCTYYLPEVRVINNGTLAVKYEYDTSKFVFTGDTKLLDALEFVGEAEGDDPESPAILLPGEYSNPLKIGFHMKETAGNEYQGLTMTGAQIAVVATQATSESDSFDNTYDKDAEYPVLVTTGDELQDIVSNATAPVNIVLANSITTNNFVIPADKDVTLDLNGFTLTGGDSHAILNRGVLCIKDSSGDGEIVASKANTSALRNGDGAVCVIDGGTFTRANGEDNKWHTVENFGTMTFNGGKVIAEDGQSFAIVNGWNYINPGEQKATMTINNIEMKAGPNGFKNCAGGILTMNGGTLHCTGYWGLSNDSTGVATINGGQIISDKYVAISNGGAKMEINGGTFTGPQGSLYVQNYAQDTVVKGGSYQNETVEFMQSYCPEGYTATLKGDMVVVSKN